MNGEIPPGDRNIYRAGIGVDKAEILRWQVLGEEIECLLNKRKVIGQLASCLKHLNGAVSGAVHTPSSRSVISSLNRLPRSLSYSISSLVIIQVRTEIETDSLVVTCYFGKA